VHVVVLLLLFLKEKKKNYEITFLLVLIQYT
jgi:hypothetical protein